MKKETDYEEIFIIILEFLKIMTYQMKECKRLKKSSKGHFVMGIGAGMIIAGLYGFVVDAYIASKEKKEKELDDSNE